MYTDQIIVNQDTKSLRSDLPKQKPIFNSLTLNNIAKSDVNNTEEVQMNLNKIEEQKQKNLKSIENND